MRGETKSQSKTLVRAPIKFSFPQLCITSFCLPLTPVFHRFYYLQSMQCYFQFPLNIIFNTVQIRIEFYSEKRIQTAKSHAFVHLCLSRVLNSVFQHTTSTITALEKLSDKTLWCQKRLYKYLFYCKTEVIVSMQWKPLSSHLLPVLHAGKEGPLAQKYTSLRFPTAGSSTVSLLCGQSSSNSGI